MTVLSQVRSVYARAVKNALNCIATTMFSASSKRWQYLRVRTLRRSGIACIWTCCRETDDSSEFGHSGYAVNEDPLTALNP